MSIIVKTFLIFSCSSIIIVSFLFFYDKKKEKACYQECSEFHLMGEAKVWEYSEYVIIENDTIWIDRECYDSWCICMDECKRGSCCELLK